MIAEHGAKAIPKASTASGYPRDHGTPWRRQVISSGRGIPVGDGGWLFSIHPRSWSCVFTVLCDAFRRGPLGVRMRSGDCSGGEDEPGVSAGFEAREAEG